MSPRLVEVTQNVLRHNDVVARELRQRFHEAGVYVVSLVSSPAPERPPFWRKRLLSRGPITVSRPWSVTWRQTTTLPGWRALRRP
jgi:hypothetical protein